ncbi:MFS transporter [Azospirillum thermophilum]|uniref:MFS transporter n=1 Tax=Azospirillum thermophilum TaxID=2202148 RepID=A0A2S2CSF0_9PROT|nr:MFS transporter [Azospirillum thermophilum]AWK87453.1 MFS transporter [Azospirillum thermophilum]
MPTAAGPRARRVIAFVNAGHFMDHLLMLVFPTAVLGMVGEAGDGFGLSYGELLPLSLGGFIAFGAGSIPAGWLGDLWSRRNMMVVFFLGMGGASVLTGFAPTPAWLAVGMTGIGLFGAIYHPVGTALLTAHARRIGREIGVNGVWGNLGIAVAALATGALTQWLGWRAAFVAPGVLCMAMGLAMPALVPDEPAVRKAGAAATAAIPRAVVVRAFAVLAVTTVFGSLVFNAAVIALPKLFDERVGALAATPLGIGALLCGVYVIGATSQLIVGRLVDRHTLRRIFIPLSLLQAPCLALAATAENWGLVAVAVAAMFAIFGQVTINDTMVARYTDQHWRARAYAIRYLVSFAASAAAVPLVAGLHERTGGFTLVFLVLAGGGAAIFLSALAFPHRPDEVAPQAAPAVAAAE